MSKNFYRTKEFSILIGFSDSFVKRVSLLLERNHDYVFDKDDRGRKFYDKDREIFQKIRGLQVESGIKLEEAVKLFVNPEESNYLDMNNKKIDMHLEKQVIGGETSEKEKTYYNVEDVCNFLKIKPGKVYNMSVSLEKYGYTFTKDKFQSRMYNQSDFEKLKIFQDLSKKYRLKNDEIARNIMIEEARGANTYKSIQSEELEKIHTELKEIKSLLQRKSWFERTIGLFEKKGDDINGN